MTQKSFGFGLRRSFHWSPIAAAVMAIVFGVTFSTSHVALADTEIAERFHNFGGPQIRSRRDCTDAVLPEVRWLAADIALVAEPIEEKYWAVRITEGSYHPVIEIEPISLPLKGLIISTRNANKVALYDVVEDQVRISTSLRVWEIPSSPPPFSDLFPDPLDRPKQERIQLFWTDNTDLVIRRSNDSSGRFACAEFHNGNQQWRLIGSCPDLGDLPGEPVTIEPLADGVFAIGTSAEGVTGISIMRMDGRTETWISELSLGMGVTAHVERYGTSGALVISSHILADGTARQAPDRCWQLYAWNFVDNSLGLLRSGLPRNARLRPEKQNEWLWPNEQGGLCLGDLDSNAQCVALPKIRSDSSVETGGEGSTTHR